MSTKICGKCNKNKSIDEFYKRTSSKDNLDHRCKSCCKQRSLDYYNKNSEVIKNNSKEYYHNNSIHVKERVTEYNKTYNYDKCGYEKQRRLNDPAFKIKFYTKNRIRKSLRNIKKVNTTNHLLGCSNIKYKHFIESRFYGGMTWKTQGQGIGKWQIHHICPLEYFNLLDPIEQQQAFHYTNTTPLWFDDHVRIHSSISKKLNSI